MISMAAETELSGGAITNVVRRCAMRMIQSKKKLLDKVMLKEALLKEKIKRCKALFLLMIGIGDNS